MANEENRPAGYSFLIERNGLDVLPNWRASFVSATGTLRQNVIGEQVQVIYPKSYWPGEGLADHLEFALKYDGVNLGILSALFEQINADELTAWIRSKPTGKYCRKAWFLYEFLTGYVLPLPGLKQGNYIELLEPGGYYTVTPGRRLRRQRIIDNLPGGRAFCPIIRRTEKLAAAENVNLRRQCEEIMTAYSPELIRRARSYLYTKETRSSFAIESITPSPSRTEKFINLLSMAEHRDFCNKASLIDLQNRIADPRFRDKDYRKSQNYVGQSISFQKQRVHYVCPKPDDLPGLMEGLLAAHLAMKEGAMVPLVHAAVVSYGFVFMHPFEDGNGRIHRFLIHNILFLRDVIPNGLMFPVSAVMLKNLALYDQSLEAFSGPLMDVVEYELDDLGRMTVMARTDRHYRYIDMTAQAEALCQFVQITVDNELSEELDFLANYDKTKQAIQEVVDLPDRLIDLFILLCRQNNGRLSATKRKQYFESLTDQEIKKMEQTIREIFAGEQ